jgi:hypothetical protein
VYSDRDIKIIKGDDHVFQNQDKYFGTKGANPESICSGIAQGALILGCEHTEISKCGNWWLVSGDIDWLKQPNQLNVYETEVFESLMAFPEAGDNWFRSEYLASVFASALVTFDGNSSKIIKGSESNLIEFNRLASKLKSKQRIVGFVFAKSI